MSDCARRHREMLMEDKLEDFLKEYGVFKVGLLI